MDKIISGTLGLDVLSFPTKYHNWLIFSGRGNECRARKRYWEYNRENWLHESALDNNNGASSVDKGIEKTEVGIFRSQRSKIRGLCTVHIMSQHRSVGSTLGKHPEGAH